MHFFINLLLFFFFLYQQTSQQWKYVYLITAGMLLGCGIIYLIFSTSNLQDWNTPNKMNENEKELEHLSCKKNDEKKTEDVKLSLKK